ncbi:hypothetical protein AcV5_002265 [Taiwanofungus camphoratus]|nr:hypothetical protein AcV5_002265 [Antrodia cinnamomea]
MFRSRSFLLETDYHDGIYGFIDTINYILGQDSPPQVPSTSYGSNEELMSRNLAYNLCNAYAQLGARGVSILFSSGDGGVSGTAFGECTAFVPSFPSGCPYITSVGGTTIIGTEVAAPLYSGGFSNYWTTPSY